MIYECIIFRILRFKVFLFILLFPTVVSMQWRLLHQPSIWSSESFCDLLLPGARLNRLMNAGLEFDVQTVMRNTNKIFIFFCS